MSLDRIKTIIIISSRNLTQTAAGTGRRETSHKVYTLDSEQSVEVVVLRNPDLIAVGVFQVRGPLTALLRVITVHRVCNIQSLLKLLNIDQS